MMGRYGSWEGADRVWEMIYEQVMDLRYEAHGPDSYRPGLKRELKEEGRWEEELSQWEEPAAERVREIGHKIEALRWAMRACEAAAQYYLRETAKVTGRWPCHRPRTDVKLGQL